MENEVKQKKWQFVVTRLLLLATIIGGCAVIMHDTCYVFGDDVQYMRCTGSGHPFHITRDIGCTPEIGRFFPMAYFTYNILLLFQSLAPLSAGWHYGVHALFWCIFLVISFALYRKLFAEKNEKYADIFALLLTLVVAQRTLEFFACLWTTTCLSITILTLGIYSLMRYSKTHKIGWLIGSAFFFCYLTFCSEHYFIVPLSMAIASILPVNGRKGDKNQFVTFVVAGLLFISIYLIWIFPQIVARYDSAHGDTSGYGENIYRIMMGQKFLFISIIVLFYRLYKVFVKKEHYDLFGDVLLVGGITLMIGGFILRLNWPLYYLPIMILSLPACVRCLDFENQRAAWLSGLVVILVCGYYIVKIPFTAQGMWNRHSGNKIEMNDFINKVTKEKIIAYYPMPTATDPMEAEWTYSGIRDWIGFYKQEPDFQLMPFEHTSVPDIIITPYGDQYSDRLSLLNEYAINNGVSICPIDTAMERYVVIKVFPELK